MVGHDYHVSMIIFIEIAVTVFQTQNTSPN